MDLGEKQRLAQGVKLRGNSVPQEGRNAGDFHEDLPVANEMELPGLPEAANPAKGRMIKNLDETIDSVDRVLIDRKTGKQVGRGTRSRTLLRWC